MTIRGDVIMPFIDWLNPPTGKRGETGFEARGLREDAPAEAKQAYERFLEIERRARERGAG